MRQHDNLSLSGDDSEQEYTALEDYLSRRFNLLTTKGHRELTALPDAVKAHAFFSAKVGRAHILERLRKVSDAYSRAETNRAEARAELTEFLRKNGYIPGGLGEPPPGVSPLDWARRRKISNLASVARLNLILEENRSAAAAVGEYQRMYDPDIKEFYPCLVYHARRDSRVRGSHAEDDGKIFDKDDPWLLTHWPGKRDFRCRCWAENAERPDDPKKVQPFGKPTIDSESGYVFRPDLAFAANDMGQLQVKDRGLVLDEMTDLVRKKKLNKCTLLCAAPAAPIIAHPLPGLPDFSGSVKAMQPEAVAFVRQAKLKPGNMPDYKEQDIALKKHGIAKHEVIPAAVKKAFPVSGVPVGTLPGTLQEGLGLKEPVNIKLSAGNGRFGVTHNWRHHKEMFTNPADSAAVLRETIGNPNARCVFDVSREKGGMKKLIVIHNPDTRAYCVLRLSDDGKNAEIVSWHRENPRYGNRQWNKN